MLAVGCGGEAEGSGQINLDELFGEADASDAPIVVFDAGRFDSSVPDAPGEVIDDSGEPDTTPPSSVVGEACAAGAAECAPGLTCLEDPGWPGGTCVRLGCDPEVGCGDGQSCVRIDDENACLPSCQDVVDCRPNYRCGVRGPGVRVCLPSTEVLGAFDGSSCEVDTDCAGGTCLEAPEYPGGYCTTQHCQRQGDCSTQRNAGLCDVMAEPAPSCLRRCNSDNDCRVDYLCEFGAQSVGTCLPRAAVAIPISQDANPLPVQCGYGVADQVAEIAVEVEAGVVSYAVAAYAADGRAIAPISVTRPDGTLVDLSGPVYDSNNPVYSGVVGTYRDVVEVGEHVYRFATESTELCALFVPRTEFGSVIDLNIYLLGARNARWDTAEGNEPLTRIIDEAREALLNGQILLRNVRFPPVPDGVREIVANDIDAALLGRYASIPSESQDGAMVLNVFMPAAITHGPFSIGPTNGPVGIHGMPGTGVVVTGEYLYLERIPGTFASEAPETIGAALAHQLGHYLGLSDSGRWDGYIMDTLPDYRWRRDWRISEVDTMLAHPLTKSEPFVEIPGTP